MIPNEIPSHEQRAENSAARYGLLRTAQSILAKSGADWKEQHRTCWCSRSLKRGSETVDVYRNANRDGATFAGLNRCGNVHTCPVCAAKVAELRRMQLSAAMAAHIANGGAAYLLTFTFPHEADETLVDLLARFDKARQRFQNAKAWKAWKKGRGVVGQVNSLEFTVSMENGWHPHIHMLVFADRGAFDEGEPDENGDLHSFVIDDFRKAWVKTLFKCGLGDQTKLDDMMRYALNVRGGEKAAEYIAKFGRDERWGPSSELARSHAKIGAAGEKWGVMHFTPFQLLVWAANRDGWAIHRFREYAEAVEGKKALVWSPGLKAALGVADIDEEEWAQRDEPAPEQVKVGQIDAEQYSTLLKHHAVPYFLRYAAVAAEGQSCLDEFIAGLEGQEETGSGALLVKRHYGGGKSVIYG